VDAILARTGSSGTTAWYLTDQVGSVRYIENTSGTVLDGITYDAFGNIVSQTDSSDGDRFMFAGMQYDATTGIYYDHARYYDAAIGRFMSQDPLGFSAGDANLYAYCANDPTNATDQSGDFWWFIVLAIIAVTTGTGCGGDDGGGGFLPPRPPGLEGPDPPAPWNGTTIIDPTEPDDPSLPLPTPKVPPKKAPGPIRGPSPGKPIPGAPGFDKNPPQNESVPHPRHVPTLTPWKPIMT
jgi:RHS repeat-associated protein